ncbi:MAG: response regulator [Bacteroidetes bacterium]|nr:response regulator [Bacteroidota bacterium]
MSKSILIVEDDPFTQQFYNYIFGKTGYKVIITEDGNEIFEFLKNEEISLIILDINLKNTYIDNERVDGIQISRKIKKELSMSSIPILLISAYQKKNGGRNYFEESLADDYILKPIIDFNLFLKKVTQLVEK